MIHPSVLHRMLPTIVPLVHQWVLSVESELWNTARPLTVQEQADALLLGVQNPDSIRIIMVDALPAPSAELKHLAEQLRILTTATASLTYSRLIVIRQDAPHPDELVLHGLVHAAQIERCGSVANFLTEYFDQCLQYGKENCPMEMEVRSKVAQLYATANG